MAPLQSQFVAVTVVCDPTEQTWIYTAAGRALSMSDVTIGAETTAVLFTDPQVELLTPDSVVWGVSGETVEANAVVDKFA